MNKHLLLNVSSGLSLLVVLFFGNMLGLLADKEVEVRNYIMQAGTVEIELTVDTGLENTVVIEPSQITTFKVGVTNVGSRECYVFIELVIPRMNGHQILSITPTGYWQKISNEELDGRNIYQYVVDGVGKALPSGEAAEELVSEARFYDFTELNDFACEVKVIAYAVQTIGFDENALPYDIWKAAEETTSGDIS